MSFTAENTFFLSLTIVNVAVTRSVFCWFSGTKFLLPSELSVAVIVTTWTFSVWMLLRLKSNEAATHQREPIQTSRGCWLTVADDDSTFTLTQSDLWPPTDLNSAGNTGQLTWSRHLVLGMEEEMWSPELTPPLLSLLSFWPAVPRNQTELFNPSLQLQRHISWPASSTSFRRSDCKFFIYKTLFRVFVCAVTISQSDEPPRLRATTQQTPWANQGPGCEACVLPLSVVSPAPSSWSLGLRLSPLASPPASPPPDAHRSIQSLIIKHHQYRSVRHQSLPIMNKQPNFSFQLSDFHWNTVSVGDDEDPWASPLDINTSFSCLSVNKINKWNISREPATSCWL